MRRWQDCIINGAWVTLIHQASHCCFPPWLAFVFFNEYISLLWSTCTLWCFPSASMVYRDMRQEPPTLDFNQGCCNYVHPPTLCTFCSLFFGLCGGAEANNREQQHDINAAEEASQSLSIRCIFSIFVISTSPPQLLSSFSWTSAISTQAFMHKLKMGPKTFRWK